MFLVQQAWQILLLSRQNGTLPPGASPPFVTPRCQRLGPSPACWGIPDLTDNLNQMKDVRSRRRLREGKGKWGKERAELLANEPLYQPSYYPNQLSSRQALGTARAGCCEANWNRGPLYTAIGYTDCPKMEPRGSAW